MKKLICLLALGLLVGCGPSAQERYDAALKRLEIEENQLDKAKTYLEQAREKVRGFQSQIANIDSFRGSDEERAAELERLKDHLEYWESAVESEERKVETHLSRVQATNEKLNSSAESLGL